MNVANGSKVIKLDMAHGQKEGREEHLFSPCEEDEDPSEGDRDHQVTVASSGTSIWGPHCSASSLAKSLIQPVSGFTSVHEQPIYHQQSRYFGFQMCESACELTEMKLPVVPQLRATEFLQDKSQEGEITLSTGPLPHCWLRYHTRDVKSLLPPGLFHLSHWEGNSNCSFCS